MCLRNVVNSSANAHDAKYAFLRETERKRVLDVAMIYAAIISLCLATIIALCMEALRRHDISTGRGAG